MASIKTYVLTKDGDVYGVFSTEQAAKAKVVSMIESNWYDNYGSLSLSVHRAEYEITPQTMEVND